MNEECSSHEKDETEHVIRVQEIRWGETEAHMGEIRIA